MAAACTRRCSTGTSPSRSSSIGKIHARMRVPQVHLRHRAAQRQILGADLVLVLRVRLDERLGRRGHGGILGCRRRCRRDYTCGTRAPLSAHRGIPQRASPRRASARNSAAGTTGSAPGEGQVVRAGAVGAVGAVSTSTLACGTRSAEATDSSWRMVSANMRHRRIVAAPSSAPSTAPGTRCRRCRRGSCLMSKRAGVAAARARGACARACRAPPRAGCRAARAWHSTSRRTASKRARSCGCAGHRARVQQRLVLPGPGLARAGTRRTPRCW